MAYIKLEDLQRYPIRAYHYDKEHGNVNFINGVEAVLEYAEQLPKADVVEVVRYFAELIKGVVEFDISLSEAETEYLLLRIDEVQREYLEEQT